MFAAATRSSLTAAGLSMLFVGLSACGLADRPFLRTRKELLRGALASGAAAFASRSADAAALPWERDVAANPLQARFLEKLRILLQDEADATQYGGELAPGGPPVGLPYLSLVPIVQMQSVLVRSRDAVADRKQWPALIKLFSTGQFETIEFKRIFNQFSDNIYYASDTTEANVYLLGGATPSSGQTQQYLLRNEAIKQAISSSYSVISPHPHPHPNPKPNPKPNPALSRCQSWWTSSGS